MPKVYRTRLVFSALLVIPFISKKTVAKVLIKLKNKHDLYVANQYLGEKKLCFESLLIQLYLANNAPMCQQNRPKKERKKTKRAAKKALS